jgi:rhamnogalacturonyl hydrolase YesR
MSVQQKLGVVALAAGVCMFGSFQRSAWSQQPASPPAATPPAGPADTPVAPPNTDAARLAGIAKDNARMFGSSPDDPGPLATNLSPAIKPAPVAAAMRKVADWQLAQSQQYFAVVDRSRQLDGRIWTWGALYSGFVAASESLGDPRYVNAMRDMGKTTHWELSPGESDANQLSLAQTYLEIYLLDKQPDELAPTKARMDAVLTGPRPDLNSGRRIGWWWCDALFMGPPAWARMYAATGDPKYIGYLDDEWAKTSTLLYDQQAHLYARDATFVEKKEKNGQKTFWSRGEGWVMAGLARTLEYLPKDDPARATYVRQLQEMAAAVAKIQQPDGLWTAGLLDPAAYNNQPEISGSALMTFGMAWGINNGILDRKTYTAVVTRAWAGMLKHIYADGRLGDIQQTGAAPSTYKPSASYNYGVGGFLLAGSEIYKMSEGKHAKK